MKNLLRKSYSRINRPLLALVVVGVSLGTVHATAQNVITDWNLIAITQARASTAPGSATPGGTNLYVAYVELAAYNAVVAIQGGYRPYKYKLSAPPGASADAAAVEAAYQMLLHLLPDRTGPLNDAHTASMAAIPDGTAKANGILLGQASASALIAERAGDGLGVPWPYSYPSSPVPGVWILTPGVVAPATPWVGQMRPFTFDNPARYFPREAPPALNSWEWAFNYNLTKALGSSTSTVRTPAQTEIGLFWTEHPGSQYGALLRLLAEQHKLSLLETARMMAMSYSAMADGLIGCFNAKYTFSFWRPVTAIRNGDIDGNPGTVPDPAWTPLAATPGHPEYPSAHGCVTGAFADALEAYFGTPRVQITVSSSVTNTTHQFSNIHDWENEVFWARIYAGFHYYHSMVQGYVLGHRVAHHITNNYFEPVKAKQHDD
jgi:hypothetical protein